MQTTCSFKYFIFSCNSGDLMLGYGKPTTIIHRPKSSEKFKPSLNLPPAIYHVKLANCLKNLSLLMTKYMHKLFLYNIDIIF